MKVIDWKESRCKLGIVRRVELQDHSFKTKSGNEVAYYIVAIDSWTEDSEGDTLHVRYNREKEFDSFKEAQIAFMNENI